MLNASQGVDHFLNHVQVQHGPRDLLTRFFSKAVNAAAARGVYLEFGTFQQLMDINRANLDTWHPMTTSFDPAYSDIDEKNGFVILGRNQDGAIVTTQAARLWDGRTVISKPKLSP